MASLEHLVSDVASGTPDARRHAERSAAGDLGAFSGVVTAILTGAVLWLGVLGIFLGPR